MAIVDWVKHALPMKLKDGKRHLFPTLASMVYLDDGKTTLVDEQGFLTADKALDAKKLGGKAPEYYTNPRNLLVNSDFRNPVNKRGLTSYTDVGQIIDQWYADRWSATGAGFTITLESNGLHISGGVADAPNGCFIRQNIDSARLAGKTVTFAVKTTSVNAVCENMHIVVDGEQIASRRLVSGGISVLTAVVQNGKSVLSVIIGNEANYAGSGTIDATIEWVALYEGSYTAETLPPYKPKGYANELLACQVAEYSALMANDSEKLGGKSPEYYLRQIASYVQFQFPNITIPKGNGYLDVPFMSNQLTFLNEQRALNRRPIVGFCSSFSNDGIMIQVHSPMVASNVTSLRFKYCNPNDADTTTQLRVVLIIADVCPIINS